MHNAMEDQVHQLEQRLDRAERRLRRTMLFAPLLGGCLLITCGWSPPDGVIETKGIRIVDDKGVLRAAIDSNNDGEVSIRLMDKEAKTGIRFTVSKSGDSDLSFLDSAGSRRISISCQDGKRLAITMSESSDRAPDVPPPGVKIALSEEAADLDLRSPTQLHSIRLSAEESGAEAELRFGTKALIRASASETGRLTIGDKNGDTEWAAPK